MVRMCDIPQRAEKSTLPALSGFSSQLHNTPRDWNEFARERARAFTLYDEY